MADGQRLYIFDHTLRRSGVIKTSRLTLSYAYTLVIFAMEPDPDVPKLSRRKCNVCRHSSFSGMPTTREDTRRKSVGIAIVRAMPCFHWKSYSYPE